MNFEDLSKKALDLCVEYGPKLLLAILVLVIGFWIIKKVVKISDKLFEKSKVDVSLRKFLLSLIGIGLKILLLISVCSMIGIETTSFVALIGAAGLAVGMALQGSLANFAGGVLILLFKPYKVGDLIEACGFCGVVTDIHIFTTTLCTADQKTIIIPNASLSNGNITNYSTSPTRRVDLVIGIDYSADIKQAKDILAEVCKNHPAVINNDPALATTIAVVNLGESSVDLCVRPYCKSADYWTVYFEILEQSKNALEKGGVSIPFPQITVHQG